MSEYQYYDFRALDRPLTAAERTALRKISTRAEISSKRFTNFYTFGDFKGDPPALVARHFDAFLYLASWGTREVIFRVPASRAPSAQLLRAHLSTSVSSSAWFRRRGPSVVLGFRSEDEEGDWESDGEGELDSIVSARSGLLNGGGRLLYLAWLVRVQAGEIAESTLEPEVPAGLGRPSASESALAEFLRIDPDLIGAAAQRPVGRGSKARRTVERLLSGGESAPARDGPAGGG